jgi:SAM-dependent methyltransferase
MDGPAPAGPRYEDVVADLRTAYNGGAVRRDRAGKAPYKLAERAAFLQLVRDAGGTRLLEIGAGTGQDSLFFQNHGLDVVATDLSPAMVARCRRKGIDARVADFLGLDFPPGTFDAVYALNCLLHVPDADLSRVLREIRAVLRPGGLFFLGVLGSEDLEGFLEDDRHRPPRFFSFRTDEQIQQAARTEFEILDFHVVGEGFERFQSLTLRRP